MNETLKAACSWGLAILSIASCISVFYNDSLWVLFTSLDTGWIVQTGQYILDHGVPVHDMFSWSNPGVNFVAYQWLFEVMSAALYRIGSLWFLGLVICICVGLLIFFILPGIWTGKGVPLFLPFVFLCLVQTPHWFNARPQLCSYFLILTFIAVMERYRSNAGRTRWLWALPPLTALWANLHSFWFIGLLVMLIYLVCDAVRIKKLPGALTGALAASLTAVLLNPYGFNLVRYIFTFVDGTQYMQIWELLPSYNSLEALWTIIYVPLAWLVLIAFRSRVPAEGFILFAVATIAAVTMRRFESIAVLTSWIYVGSALATVRWSTLLPPVKRNVWFTAAQLALAVLVPIITWYCRFPTIMSAWMVYTEDSWPLLAIVQKHTAPADHLVTDPAVGSWLIAMGAGPVFVDTRLDMYPKAFISELHECLNGEDRWAHMLERWNASAVIARDDSVLNRMLMASADWTLALDDGTLGWWLRNSGNTPQKLQQWQLSDDCLSAAGLPQWILDATVQGRCAKYLVLARLHLMDHDPASALKYAESGLILMPQSQDLKTETELCSRLLRNHMSL